MVEKRCFAAKTVGALLVRLDQQEILGLPMSQPISERSSEGPGGSFFTVSCNEENSSALAAVYSTFSLWLKRRRRRQSLLDLADRNDHLLADVGLTQEEALREAAKPFWRR